MISEETFLGEFEDFFRAPLGSSSFVADITKTSSHPYKAG
jgi:hypothetical protein